MSEFQEVIYERVYSVHVSYPAITTGEFATPEAAGAHVAELLREGRSSITVYLADRPKVIE